MTKRSFTVKNPQTVQLCWSHYSLLHTSVCQLLLNENCFHRCKSTLCLLFNVLLCTFILRQTRETREIDLLKAYNTYFIMCPAMGNGLQCKPSGQLHTVKICPGAYKIWAVSGKNVLIFATLWKGSLWSRTFLLKSEIHFIQPKTTTTTSTTTLSKATQSLVEIVIVLF